MTTIEIQDFIHVYSMFSFRDGRKEPGIVINKYNLEKAEVEFFFIPHPERSSDITCRLQSDHAITCRKKSETEFSIRDSEYMKMKKSAGGWAFFLVSSEW